MGGRALGPDVATVRLPTERMEPIARALAAALGGGVVDWLRDKRDHGDADLVVPASALAAVGTDADVAALAARVLGVPVIHRRRDVRDPILFLGARLPEGTFQIDLLGRPDEEAEFARRALSWGDLGTMIGRIARETGLAFGQNGLRLPVRVADATAESLLLTADFDEALDHLGLDGRIHADGFGSMEESVAFLASSRLFSPVLFRDDRLTSDARSRARRRPDRPALDAAIAARPARYPWPEGRADADLQRPFVETAIERFGAGDAVAAAVARMEASAASRPPSRDLSAPRLADLAGLARDERGLVDARALFAMALRALPADVDAATWKRTAPEEEIAEAMRARTPQLAAQRADEARRAVATEAHRIATEARAARLEANLPRRKPDQRKETP